MIVDKPSPKSDLLSPGSLDKSFPTMLLVTTKWPTCSATTTKVAGKIVKIAFKLGLAICICGNTKRLASFTCVKSTSPKKTTN